jgi:hypothetical protein
MPLCGRVGLNSVYEGSWLRFGFALFFRLLCFGFLAVSKESYAKYIQIPLQSLVAYEAEVRAAQDFYIAPLALYLLSQIDPLETGILKVADENALV